MKKSYQHIIKKSYTTPKIEEVEIDVATSLNPPTVAGEDDTIPQDPNMPDNVENPQAVNYGSKTYHSSTSPFGDTSAPRY